MNVWIFQARPERYDLIKEVPARISIGDWWTVPRFTHEMAKGDPILFWKSGDDAGIYATGKVSGNKPRKAQGKWRLDVKYAGLLKEPVLRKILVKDSVLKGLSVIKQPRGGNFKVTPEQWNKLKRLQALKRVMLEKPSTIPFSIVKQVAKSGTFNPRNLKDARERIQASIICRQGQPEFRRQLLGLYGGKCMITGCDAEEALEAAHICPYKGRHTNHPENGLLLRADLHTLFDQQLMAVNTSTMTLILAPSLKSTNYRDLQGKRLNIPKKCPLPPNKEALDQHRKLTGL